MASLRLFIAIELDDALRAEIETLERRLENELRARSVARAVRWVAPQNIHLTLKFLGNTDAARVPALVQALGRATMAIEPFELTARGLGCFPNPRRPNNVWVGLTGGTASAAWLARRIEDEFAALGAARDPHGLAPHLTLARVHREASPADRAAIGELVQSFPVPTLGILRVDSIALLASDLRPGGPVYTTLARQELDHAPLS